MALAKANPVRKMLPEALAKANPVGKVLPEALAKANPVGNVLPEALVMANPVGSCSRRRWRKAISNENVATSLSCARATGGGAFSSISGAPCGCAADAILVAVTLMWLRGWLL